MRNQKLKKIREYSPSPLTTQVIKNPGASTPPLILKENNGKI